MKISIHAFCFRASFSGIVIFCWETMQKWWCTETKSTQPNFSRWIAITGNLNFIKKGFFLGPEKFWCRISQKKRCMKTMYERKNMHRNSQGESLLILISLKIMFVFSAKTPMDWIKKHNFLHRKFQGKQLQHYFRFLCLPWKNFGVLESLLPLRKCKFWTPIEFKWNSKEWKLN